MNITDKSALRECTSCQLCATMCSRGAIKIELSEMGFYRPVVDADKCTDCGLCTKVCYKFDAGVRMTTKKQLSETDFYSAWSNDDAIVKSTTSGGIGDLLAHVLLKEGYKVVGCAYDDKKARAEHRIASSAEDLLPFRGSKYIQSYTFDALKEVVKTCREEKYAVFGTPCQIYALSKIAEMKKCRDNFFFVDLYCHGCPSLLAWQKYLKYIKAKEGFDSFDKVEFRSKTLGWGAFCVSFYKKGKLIFNSSRNLHGFYELFFCDQILNDGCHECQLRGTHEYTDIRLGDFWGKKYLNNTRGVSGVSIVTVKAKSVFDKIKASDVTVDACKYEEFLPYQSWGKVHHPITRARSEILASLGDPSQDVWDAINALHRNRPLKAKISWGAKEVLAFFPLKFVNLLKRLR